MHTKLKSRLRWLLLGALGLLLLAAILAVLLLPRLIDVESYRGLLRSNLERQLGREVEFGAMELSLWPGLGLRLDDLAIGRTPAERFDKPLVAESLRVGARLFPLLRGRLEVTSLVVEGPVLSLYLRDDGAWEPDLAAAGAASPAGPADADAPALVVEQLRLTRGRVVLRREVGGRMRESVLEGLALELDGVGTGGPVSFELTTALGPSGTLRVGGTLQPADEAAARPLRLSARLAAEGLRPATLRDWVAALAPSARWPDDLLVDRPFAASAAIAYTEGRPARLTISNAVIRDPGLRLVRSASAVWNYQVLVDSAGAGPPDATQPGIALQFDELKIEGASVRVEDHPARGETAAFELARLNLTLRQTAPDAALEIDLEAQAGSSRDGKLTLRGKIGPVGDDPAAMPLDLSVGLSSIALGEFHALFPEFENPDVSRATAQADLKLTGSLARELQIRGDVSMSGATVSFVSPHGEPRSLPFGWLAHGDLRLRDAAGRIDVSKLELELPGAGPARVLTLCGSIDATADPPRIDLELLPVRLPADDIATLAALLAPDLPLSFSSSEPVELELRARGPLGGDSVPDLEGRATLAGFTFRVAGMTQPMERVGATVTFAPDRLTLDGLSGVIGKSDVTDSRVVITNFTAPRVQLELKSNHADFWELFSFVESTEPSPGAAAPPPADDPFAQATIEGRLSIARGSLQTLAFENLATAMDFRGGVLTLAPLELELYGGRFSGRLVQDLNSGALTISGDGLDVDVDGFLAQNLALGNLISGRASTELAVVVRAADPSNLLAGVSGGGPLRLVDGRLARLDVLKSLSEVTGIFGERSLQRLTRQFAVAGTPFRRAEARLSFDSGRLAFEDLVLEIAELSLAGSASLDSATGKLAGRFAVSFAPELSAAMRDEHSRAAELFWDAKAGRVSFGFEVGGLATAPSVSVDWNSAIRGVAERKFTDGLRGLVERKLGPGSGAQASEAVVLPAPAAAAQAQPGTDPAPPAESGSPATAALRAEITRTRWKGPVLLRDLALEGTVRGVGIERASILVLDASGVQVQQIDRLRAVDDQLAGSVERDSPQNLAWSVTIDGKRLLAARFPLDVTVTVHDGQGRSAAGTRSVDR